MLFIAYACRRGSFRLSESAREAFFRAICREQRHARPACGKRRHKKTEKSAEKDAKKDEPLFFDDGMRKTRGVVYWKQKKRGGAGMDKAEKRRLIFHCDCNNFFASCECLDRPELKNVPLAVAGDPENRVGVVVAKNDLAKKYGVKTTDTVWQAKRKCPGIVFVPPRHRLYKEISDRINGIYREYTDYVEPASIDESYLDMTGAPAFYKMTDRDLADSLRSRVRNEIGVTISVGVSFNKIFAKMGSDYRKPDATTVITPENYRDILWPLPVSDMMFAGKAAVAVLNGNAVETIGDLAVQTRERLGELLGKGGEQLWIYANGLDTEPVRKWGDRPEIKSVSRGTTFKRDLIREEEIRTGVLALADDVATALRRHGMKGSSVSVQIKSPDLRVISRQSSLDHYTCLQHEIRDAAMRLIRNNWPIGEKAPIRAITVGVSKLLPADQAGEQTDLFDLLGPADAAKPSAAAREKQEKLEAAVDRIRKRFGKDAITLGGRRDEEIGIERFRRRDE